MKVMYGCTRIVILTKKYAIKIPQFKFQWNHFLLGLLANIQEAHFSKVRNEDRVCPVLFHVWGGFLLVMPKCVKITRDEFFKLDSRRFWPIQEGDHWKYTEKSFFPGEYVDNDNIYNIPVENKEDSFGWYKNRIVAIDYGS